MGLQFVAIRVMDLEESLKFYTEDLGLTVVDTKSYMLGETVVSLLDEETGQRLNLMHYTEECRLYRPYKVDGDELDHLSFEVPDAREKFDELVKKGASVAWDLVERKTEAGTFKMGFVKDPNGIWVGFRSQHKE